MCNRCARWISFLFFLVSIATQADEPEISLSADFLTYLAEFSDEQGEILDPEMLMEIMARQQIASEQESTNVDIQSEVLAEEIKQ